MLGSQQIRTKLFIQIVIRCHNSVLFNFTHALEAILLNLIPNCLFYCSSLFFLIPFRLGSILLVHRGCIPFGAFENYVIYKNSYGF